MTGAAKGAKTVEITYLGIAVRVHVSRLDDGRLIADPFVQTHDRGVWSSLFLDDHFSTQDIADILKVAITPDRESDTP